MICAKCDGSKLISALGSRIVSETHHSFRGKVGAVCMVFIDYARKDNALKRQTSTVVCVLRIDHPFKIIDFLCFDSY